LLPASTVSSKPESQEIDLKAIPSTPEHYNDDNDEAIALPMKQQLAANTFVYAPESNIKCARCVFEKGLEALLRTRPKMRKKKY